MEGEKFHFSRSVRLFSRSMHTRVYIRENKTRVGRFAYPVMNLNRPMNIYTVIRLFSSPVLVRKSLKPTRPLFAFRPREENRPRFSAIFIRDPRNEQENRNRIFRTNFGTFNSVFDLENVRVNIRVDLKGNFSRNHDYSSF